MLVINQWLNRLAAACLVFTQHNMLDGPLVPSGLIPVIDLDGLSGGESDDEERSAIDGEGRAIYDVQLARRHGMCPQTLLSAAATQHYFFKSNKLL